jgi:hypothetical protein
MWALPFLLTSERKLSILNFSFILGGGVRPTTLALRPQKIDVLYPPSYDRIDHRLNDNRQGRSEGFGEKPASLKICSQETPTRIALGLNRGLPGEKPLTNRLRHSMARPYCLSINLQSLHFAMQSTSMWPRCLVNMPRTEPVRTAADATGCKSYRSKKAMYPLPWRNQQRSMSSQLYSFLASSEFFMNRKSRASRF